MCRKIKNDFLAKNKKSKNINYYYLIAGFLAILFSITHELNGQYNTIPALYSGELDVNVITTFKSIWHIITAENFIFGIVLIIMAFCKGIKNIRFMAWLICVILITRLFVIVGTTLMIDVTQLIHLMIDVVAIIVYTIIILLGTRANNDSAYQDSSI